MTDAYVFDAVRTPRGRGKANGALHTVKPIHLLTTVLTALGERNGLRPAEVDDVIVGCVTQTGEQGACIARFAALAAWPGTSAPGVTVNRFCASGLEAVRLAAAMVASGFQRRVVAGGVESMSRVPMGADGGAALDPEIVLGPGSVPQGISADLLATLDGISREEADRFAVESQTKASRAVARDAFARSLVPVSDDAGRLLTADEHPRPGTSVEDLARLEPSFRALGEDFGLDALVRLRYPEVETVRHVHHAGNSSGIVDGASAVLVGSRDAGGTPRARIRATGLSAEDPILMLTGPVAATENALARAGMSVRDIDLFECNEAFAAVPLHWMRRLEVPEDRVNVNGGAIAFGHPLGATGAILLGTALDELEARGLGTALVTLCVGGGMGIALVLERV